MLRSIWINPLALSLAAVAGTGICHLLRINPHPREMVLALGCSLAASEMAIIPLLFLRRASVAVFGQATLACTLLNMLLIIFFGVALFFVMRPNPAFLYWLIAGYWITLISLASLLIGAVRTAASTQQQH